MREIKFRGFHECKDGKTVITVKGKKKRGTWFYGSYCPYTWSFAGRRINEPQIIIHDENNENDGLWVEVVPETVGQFTGLKDKKGKEIFEGDIVRTADGNVVATIKIGECCPPPVKIFCELRGIDNHKIYCLHAYDKDGEYLIEDNKSLEIIGNIYENPDLSEVTNNE